MRTIAISVAKALALVVLAPALISGVAAQLGCDGFMSACSTNCAAERSEREIKRAIKQARYEGEQKKRRAAYRKTAPYGGPAASQRAMPRWGYGATWRVPRLPKIAQAYTAAKAASAGKALGLDDFLVCRTTCRGKCVWDGSVAVTLLTLGHAQKADMRVSLHVGDEELAVGAQSSNGKPAYVNLPAAGLRVGQRLRLRVVDVDGALNIASEDMGEVEVTVPAKLPISYQAKSFEGRCYALPSAQVEERVVDLFIEAEGLLREQRKRPLRQRRSSFAWTQVRDARRAVGKIAALVGWADPRVVKLLAKVRASWRRLVAYHVGDGRKPGPVAKELRERGAELRAVVCGARAVKLRDRLQPPKRHGKRTARLIADARCLAWVHMAKVPDKRLRLHGATLLTSRGFAIDMRDVLPYEHGSANSRRDERRRGERGRGMRRRGKRRRGKRHAPAAGFDLLYAPLQRGPDLQSAAMGQPRMLVFTGIEPSCPSGIDGLRCRATRPWLPLGKK